MPYRGGLYNTKQQKKKQNVMDTRDHKAMNKDTQNTDTPTRYELIPVLVTPRMIKYDIFSLDAYDGYMEGPTKLDGSERHMLKLRLCNYSDLSIGDVFVVYDEDNCYPWSEPSCYLMKQEFGNFYLTTCTDYPLGVNRSLPDRVWRVIR